MPIVELAIPDHCVEPVAVASVGLVCSVGHDSVTAAASIRAGLARPRGLPTGEVLELHTGRSTPAMGHLVMGVAEGFEGGAKWLQLAPLAIEDAVGTAMRSGRSARELGRNAAMIVALPFLDTLPFYDDPVAQPDELERTFVRSLLSRVEPFWIPSAPSEVVCQGRVGSLAALIRGQRWVSEGRFERVLVVATEALTDPWSISYLADLGVLKSDLVPSGFVPGEAAAAVLIESLSTAREPLATLESVAVELEPEAHEKGLESRATALGRTTESCLDHGGFAERTFGGALLHDHNGEEWRARELGHWMSTASRMDWDRTRRAFPAVSTGEIGAATALAAVAYGSRMFEREPRPPNDVLITSADGRGFGGAIHLRACGASTDGSER